VITKGYGFALALTMASEIKNEYGMSPPTEGASPLKDLSPIPKQSMTENNRRLVWIALDEPTLEKQSILARKLDFRISTVETLGSFGQRTVLGPGRRIRYQKREGDWQNHEQKDWK
jgi:hypothetical protein